MQKSSTNTTNKPQTNANVAWHDFTLKELLKISKQNSWTDVNKDITTLILSLSKYNPTKIQNNSLSPMSIDQEELKDDNKTETQTSNNPTDKTLETLREELCCDICLDCYIEPLTLMCGHTFCRLCIMQINSKCDKKCPLCKTVCHIDPTLHSQNIVISNCTKQIFPSNLISKRIEQLNKERESLKRNIPVFILNMVRYPGMVLDLHLFEPRYLHMINRAISSGNKFAYLCKTMNNSGGYQPYDSDIATLIKIKECQFLPDGRCLMQGIVEKRIKVVQNWVEKGTQGLWYVKYSDYMDKDIRDGKDNENSNSKLDLCDKDHLKLLNKFVEYVYSQTNVTIRAVENDCNGRQHLSENNIEQWSFWICSLIYVVMKNAVSISWIKNQLHSQDTMERIQSCYDVLKSTPGKWNDKE